MLTPKNFILLLSLIFAVLINVFILIGCDKQDSHPTPSTPVTYYQPNYNTQVYSPGLQAYDCPAQGTSGSQLLVAPSSAEYNNMGNVQGSFRISVCAVLTGDTSQIQQWLSLGRPVPYYYTGSLNLSGNMTISNPATMGTCILPAGQYTVQSLSPGLYNPVSFMIPNFEATSGNYRIVFQLRRGWTRDADADNLINRLTLDLVAVSLQVGSQPAVSCQDFTGLILN